MKNINGQNVTINRTIEIAELEGGGEAEINKTVASSPGGLKVSITVVSQSDGDEGNNGVERKKKDITDKGTLPPTNSDVERKKKDITDQENLPPILV